MVKGLIFDFDGLVLDTETPAFLAWREVFARRGCEFPLGLWLDSIGRFPNPFDPCDRLEECLKRPVDRASLHREQQRREAELIAQESILPGVTDYLESAHGFHLKLGLASSSSREWVIRHLSHLGLAEAFDAIRTADEVARTKPDPELYLSVLAALALAPEEVVALEDSPHGVSAAKQAGIFCIAIPNPLTREIPIDHADLTLRSLAEVPLGRLLEMVEKEKGRTHGVDAG